MTSAVFAGPEGAEEREETGDAAGVVGLGASRNRSCSLEVHLPRRVLRWRVRISLTSG